MVCLAFILCLYRPRPRLFLHPRSPLLSIYYTPTETYWDTTHRPRNRMHALLLPARRRCRRRWTVPAHLGARHERPRERYGREGQVLGDERERAGDFAEGASLFLDSFVRGSPCPVPRPPHFVLYSFHSADAQAGHHGRRLLQLHAHVPSNGPRLLVDLSSVRYSEGGQFKCGCGECAGGEFL